MATKKPADVSAAPDEAVTALSYEQAREELAHVVERLEAGGLSLDDSLAMWERGEELARVCEKFLAGARERVDAALARAEEDH
ncbi:exodeoxyribonuclease VII small subunit [Nakamurella silvestris]|nr:exodeoxyribonuclease VII small subunit [Nakamurella silvestris]